MRQQLLCKRGLRAVRKTILAPTRLAPALLVHAWPSLAAILVAGILALAVSASAQAADAKSTVRDKAESGSAAENDVVALINQKVAQAWEDNEVSPSPEAKDAEWLRRVYLDIVGHIPSASDVRSFLKDKSSDKRKSKIDELLDDPNYIRNWTTIWTNLSIGRQTPRRVSRPGMESFYRRAFGKNRPWNEVVFDLVTAEGHFEENGATNYLLAQMTMRDEGVQATAKTARLFLGLQVQCTQCHHHPFNDWKQDEFWQLNSFFRQARRRDVRKYDPDSGRMVDDYSELERGNYSGPVFFEKRNGEMQVAYPIFYGKEISRDNETDRRKELGGLMTNGESPLIARAMVNRMWAHFFGYGFTRPVDDMGPHKAPSHPDLLDGLAAAFVKSNYDVKQLIGWICQSDAYQLSSKVTSKNKIDDPAAGEMPLFSHLYLKSMEAEQLYDSLLVATSVDQSNKVSWDDSQDRRQRWMQQFVVAFGTDENDESTTFNGTIPQALMMMNGELVRNALSTDDGSYLRTMLQQESNDKRRIQRLYLSTLNRYPTSREMKVSLNLVSSPGGPLLGYKDLLWALLNSNEFIFVH